jgi:hypothetical protein
MFRSQAFRLQYISDIHLERMHRAVFSRIVRPVAGTLALAGDIGHPHKELYAKFIQYCKENWDDVILVAGNHEFDEEGYTQQIDRIRDICSQWRNVHFLHNESVYLNHLGVNFCGTTLWTETTKPRLHKEAITWLDSALYTAEMLQQDTVVVSHYRATNLLSRGARPPATNHPPLYTTNLEDMLCWPVRAWISGHSHHQREVKLQLDDPPTEVGEIILAVNAYEGGGDPAKTLAFRRMA